MSSLLVGVYQDDGLRYVGEVEFGFSPASRAVLWQQFQRLTVPLSVFTNLPRKRGATWLTPRLVATVTFQEWMEGFLRRPCFVEMRGKTQQTGHHDDTARQWTQAPSSCTARPALLTTVFPAR